LVIEERQRAEGRRQNEKPEPSLATLGSKGLRPPPN